MAKKGIAILPDKDPMEEGEESAEEFYYQSIEVAELLNIEHPGKR
ncbi:hypothetical protein V7152_08020 [Neobacillus drentensis]